MRQPLSPRKFVLFAGIVAFLGLAGCSHERNPWDGLGGPPRVLVSFPPLYSFAKSVAGNDAAVLSLLTNQGPHDYDFQARDVLMLREAHLFFVNGLDLDDKYTEKMKNSCGNAKLEYVPLGKSIPKAQLIAIGKEVQHAGHTHPAGNDPHVWLGIPEAIEMVNAIRAELKKIDLAHAAGYEERARKYIEELKKLREEGKESLGGKEIKVVSFHGALGYFARTFDLRVVATLQGAAGRDLAPEELRDVARQCASEGVSIIAIEPQFPQSRRIAEDIAKKVEGLGKPPPKIITIDPLETADATELDAGWYVRKMRENIQQLADAVK